MILNTVADPGFPMGGHGPTGGGRGPLTWALFDKNVCENERIVSHRGRACAQHTPLDPPMLEYMFIVVLQLCRIYQICLNNWLHPYIYIQGF